MGFANYHRDFVFDNWIVKIAIWGAYIVLLLMVVKMMSSTSNILASLASAVCIAPFILGTFFCCVTGGIILLVFIVALSFISEMFLSSLFSPSSVVLGDGTRLTGIKSDMISGTMSSGVDSLGNVWDYIGNGKWSKR